MGIAVGVYRDSSATLLRFGIARSSLCGLHIAYPASADAHDGEIRGCAIGACIGVDGYDLSRVSDGVLFTDNDTNLQASMLPVPDSLPTVP